MTSPVPEVERWSSLKVWLFSLFNKTPESNLVAVDRMALGADRTSVSWLVVREAITLVAVGAALGLPLAFMAARGVLTLLHGVDAVDPASYSQATVLLLIVAGLAAYLPAHRASRIDPMVALRSE